MGAAFDVRGTASLIKKKTAFRNYDRVLRRRLGVKMSAAMKPAKAEIRKSARETLPHKGGLGETVARSKITTRTLLTGKGAGVRLVMASEHDIDAMNQGNVRHPLFGNREFWYQEALDPGWWSDAVDKVQPLASVAAKQVLDEIAEGRHG